ncbi:MAG: TIGR01212 family radical SAM protein [Eubacterium sp.]|jgi:radical SAM protein, TIGR01212 family|nr:TIGR01212 family radical SAM protein [Eubacterium sp.]
MQFEHWHGKRYYSLDAYIKNTYGEKMYRISLNGGMTCPNRDGTCGTGGCIFCSEGGSGDFAGAAFRSVTEQIDNGKTLLRKKTKCRKFIAYFQAFSNTYAPTDRLRSLYMEAVSHPDVAIVSIATRSDCMDDDIIELLCEINRIKPVWIELGLQSIHPATHEFIQSGVSLSCFETAVWKLQQRSLPVICHVILGFPGETREQMLETVRYAASGPFAGIKIHKLFILHHTRLGEYYQKHPFPIMNEEEYCELIADCLELLPPQMVIHRLTGDGPKKLLIEPQWTTRKLTVFNRIQQTLEERNTWQGKYFRKEDAIWPTPRLYTN